MDRYLQYGICILPVVPMRGAPKHDSEMVTQLLFGETYRVIEYSGNKEWLFIEAHYDSYRGWLSASQYHRLTSSLFEQLQQQDKVYVSQKHQLVHSQYGDLLLSIASVYPYNTDNYFSIGGERFRIINKCNVVQKINTGELIRYYSNLYLGTSYLWGGKSVFGIDCSGFVQQVFKLCAIRLARDAKDQYKQGDHISFNERQMGDIAFFNEGGRVVHVGIIVDRDSIIHASGRVRVDSIREEGIYCGEQDRFTHRYTAIRRVNNQWNES